MKLLITAEVVCDGSLYSIEKEELDWLINDILLGEKDRLILHSNEIGDEIGEVKILSANVIL